LGPQIQTLLDARKILGTRSDGYRRVFVLAVPAKCRHGGASLHDYWRKNRLAVQIVAVTAIFELFDAAADFEMQLRCHGDIAIVEQAVNVAAQQQTVAGLADPAADTKVDGRVRCSAWLGDIGGVLNNSVDGQQLFEKSRGHWIKLTHSAQCLPIEVAGSGNAQGRTWVRRCEK
jgi:hypothetical protein